MELGNVITLFEGVMYKVGTGTQVVTIPAKTRRVHGWNEGDVITVAVIKHMPRSVAEKKGKVEEYLDDIKSFVPEEKKVTDIRETKSWDLGL